MIRRNLLELQVPFRAYRLDKGTARREAAARLGIYGACDLTLDRTFDLPVFEVGHGYGLKQRLGVRMQGLNEELVSRRFLDALPQVHYGYVIADMLDYR